jgi:hypothetical protein
MDIYGYHWWFPFHEIPCPPELTHKIKFWLHSPPEPTWKKFKSQRTGEKSSCSVMKTNSSLKVLKYLKPAVL